MHKFAREHALEGNARMVFKISIEEKDQPILENYTKEQFDNREKNEEPTNQHKLHARGSRLEKINLAKEGDEPKHLEIGRCWDEK